jgi:hypothetical protein
MCFEFCTLFLKTTKNEKTKKTKQHKLKRTGDVENGRLRACIERLRAEGPHIGARFRLLGWV